eukprot:Anaeramoba_flamelloidesc39500_g1_i2.p1 GENE.c39500_g1_i2~~c39500_g1_i2.p1  ORF type:complete len:263 (+),score=57.50 c39500_g1_i2:130-918(+)
MKRFARTKKTLKLYSVDSFCSLLDLSWYKLLYKEFEKPYFKKLSEFLMNEHSNGTVIYPPFNLTFNFVNHSKLPETKVIILGQDPYIRENQAHGLSFSVPNGIRPPPSLKNIYKELSTDIKGFESPQSGNLETWSAQGVLLLNASLTVKKGQSNSHKSKGWQKFTDQLITLISNKLNNCVFILWGGFAQRKSKLINSKKHLILKGTHPSPLSARNGFFGCKHFSKTNSYLEEHGKSKIDWKSIMNPEKWLKKHKSQKVVEEK